MDFNHDGPDRRKEKRTKILVILLLIATVALIIVGITVKIVDAQGEKEARDQGNKIVKSEGSVTPDTKETTVGSDQYFSLTNPKVAPGITVTSYNGEFNPEDSKGYAGLSIQISHNSAAPNNKISYELYSSSGIVDGFVEGGLPGDAVQKATNIIDRTEFYQAGPYPADILYWFPIGDEEEALLTVRAKNMDAQSEFLRFGIEIRKNEAGAYEMTGLKDIEIREASNPHVADIAYASLPQMYKDIIPNKTCKISTVGQISNTMAIYVKPDDSVGFISDLSGQLGVTFNFTSGLGLYPITVYLDSGTLAYLGYDKYDQTLVF